MEDFFLLVCLFDSWLSLTLSLCVLFVILYANWKSLFISIKENNKKAIIITSWEKKRNQTGAIFLLILLPINQLVSIKSTTNKRGNYSEKQQWAYFVSILGMQLDIDVRACILGNSFWKWSVNRWKSQD